MRAKDVPKVDDKKVKSVSVDLDSQFKDWHNFLC
jgi:hypothetical protein